MNKPTSPERPWFSIVNKADDSADVMIYDVVGWETTAKKFVSDLKAIKAKTINLSLNTPGGSVFDGFAIYNALKDHPACVNVTINGIAASIGSVIAMAGDTIRIAKNGMMMIHNASGFVMGESGDMRKTADLLDKLTAQIAQAYADHTDTTPEQWRGLMDAETWFTAQEAKDAGLVNDILPDKPKAKASAEFVAFAMTNFNRVPESLRAHWSDTPSGNPGPAIQPVQSSAGAPAAQTEKQAMKPEDFSKYAAENPEAVEVKNLVARGHATGVAAATAAAKTTLTEIIAACPNRLQFAVDQFLAGKDLETVKGIVAALDKETKAQADQITVLKAENDRLKTPVSNGTAAIPAGAAATAQATAAGANPIAEFDKRVTALTEKGMNRAKAINQVASEDPALHVSYLAAKKDEFEQKSRARALQNAGVAAQ